MQKMKQNWIEDENFLPERKVCFGRFPSFQSVQTNGVHQIHLVFALIFQKNNDKYKMYRKKQRELVP